MMQPAPTRCGCSTGTPIILRMEDGPVVGAGGEHAGGGPGGRERSAAASATAAQRQALAQAVQIF